jgi:hypothetical protein
MADVIPASNLPPEAQPWGREVQRIVQNSVSDVARNSLDAVNNAKQLTSTINNLTEQLQLGIGNVYNKAEVDGKDATVSANAASSLSAGLSGKENNITVLNAARGGTETTNVYNNGFSSGSWRATYALTTGVLGYVVSTREAKQDFEPTRHNVLNLLNVPLQSWRYKDDVELNEDEAIWRTGFIAEDIHDSGNTWLVEYNEDGTVAGLADARFGAAAIAMVQSVNTKLLEKIAQLEERINKLEDKVN